MVGDDAVRGFVRPVRRHLGQIGDDRIRARTDRWRSCHECLAERRRCAQDPCRYRSMASASSTRLPPSSCSYCMNTRFQISMKRSPSELADPGGPPGICVAVVEENFRARPAWSGVAHRPEIVRAGDAHDLAVGKARDLLPQLEGVIVVDINGDQSLSLGSANSLVISVQASSIARALK